MSKLNPVAQKWVEALRSDRFTQTKRFLRTKEGFCCLGVACELYREENGGEWTDAYTGIAFESSVKTLPDKVKDWLHLRSDNGSFRQGCLSQQNDQGMTFAEIADLIEQHADELFEPEAA